VSYGLLAAYAGAAVVTAVVVLATGTRHPAAALVAYGLLAAIVAAHTRSAAAPGIALVAWLFYDGFIIGRHAHLSWHGAADVKRLAILLAAGAIGSALGARIRAARPGPAPGDGPPLAPDHASRS
jgi:K+-sensing histidine kinase KdpD